MSEFILVDDSRTIQKMVSRICLSHIPEAKIITASSGEEVMELIPLS